MLGILSVPFELSCAAGINGLRRRMQFDCRWRSRFRRISTANEEEQRCEHHCEAACSNASVPPDPQQKYTRGALTVFSAFSRFLVPSLTKILEVAVDVQRKFSRSA